jgi:hypothetical protein
MNENHNIDGADELPAGAAEEAGKLKPAISLSAKAVLLCIAAFKETKRHLKLARLKAQMEKLTLIDLNKSQYILGKKCYKFDLFKEQFSGRCDEIARLKQIIEEKRQGTMAAEGESGAESVKRGMLNMAMQAKAEGLSLKLKRAFIALGKEVESAKLLNPGIEAELASLELVRDSMLAAEREYASTRADDLHLADSFFKESTTSSIKCGLKSGTVLYKKKSVALIALGVITIIAAALICHAVIRSAGRSMAFPEDAKAMSTQGGRNVTRTVEPPVTSPKIDYEHFQPEDAQKEYDNLAKSYGVRYNLLIQKKLNPGDFGFSSEYSDRLYQAEITGASPMQYAKRDLVMGNVTEAYANVGMSMLFAMGRPTLVILVTSDTTYVSAGKTELLGKLDKELEVKMEDGFPRKVAILIEQRMDPMMENRLVDLSRMISEEQSRRSEIALRAMADKERQDALNYAPTVLSKIPVAPAIHLSKRLREAEFIGNARSTMLSKAVLLSSKQDWDAIFALATGRSGKISSKSEVDVAAKKLKWERWSVSLQSSLFHPNAAGTTSIFFEPYKEMNHQVFFGAIAMPPRASALVSRDSTGGVYLALPHISNSQIPDQEGGRFEVRPDKNGFIYTPERATVDQIYFFAYVFGEAIGSEKNSEDIKDFAYKLQEDLDKKRRQVEAGSLSREQLYTEAQRMAEVFYTFVGTTLMENN